jgi:dephospho-CoA kinase
MAFKMRGTSMNGKNKFTTSRGKLTNAVFQKPRVTLGAPRDDERISTDEYKRNLEEFAEKAGYTRGEIPIFERADERNDDQTFSSYADEDTTLDEIKQRARNSGQDKKRWNETKDLLKDYKNSDFKIDLDSFVDEKGSFIAGSGEADRSNPIFRDFVNKYKDNFKTGDNRINLTKAKAEFNKAFDLAANLDNELKMSASRGYGFDSGIPIDTVIRGSATTTSPGDYIKPEDFGINLENQDRYKVNPQAKFNRARNNQLKTELITEDKINKAKADFLSSVDEGRNMKSSSRINLKNLDPDYYYDVVEPFREMSNRDYKKYLKAKKKNPNLNIETYINPGRQEQEQPKAPVEEEVAISGGDSGDVVEETKTEQSFDPRDTNKDGTVDRKEKRAAMFADAAPPQRNQNYLTEVDDDDDDDGGYVPQSRGGFTKVNDSNPFKRNQMRTK